MSARLLECFCKCYTKTCASMFMKGWEEVVMLISAVK